MKRICLVMAGLFVGWCVVASPSAAWVPAETDALIVGHALDVAQPEVENVWRKAFEQISELKGKTDENVWAKENPEAYEVLRLWCGISKDQKTPSMKSMTCAIQVKQLKEKDAKSAQDVLQLVWMVENPKVDMAALDAAVEKLFQRHFTEGERTVTIKRVGEWRQLIFSGESVQEDKGGFVGYCPIQNGLLFVLTDEMRQAENIRTGKVPTLKTNHPLFALFKPLAGSVGGSVRMGIRDFSSLCARVSQAAESGLSPKSDAIGLMQAGICLTKQAEVACLVRLEYPTEEAARKQAEKLEQIRAMAVTMLLPTVLQKQDSVTAALVQAINCEVRGRALSLKLALTPERAAAWVREGLEFQARQEQVRHAAQNSPKVDVDFEE